MAKRASKSRSRKSLDTAPPTAEKVQEQYRNNAPRPTPKRSNKSAMQQFLESKGFTFDRETQQLVGRHGRKLTWLSKEKRESQRHNIGQHMAKLSAFVGKPVTFVGNGERQELVLARIRSDADTTLLTLRGDISTVAPPDTARHSDEGFDVLIRWIGVVEGSTALSVNTSAGYLVAQ